MSYWLSVQRFSIFRMSYAIRGSVIGYAQYRNRFRWAPLMG
jgi:hypothetical protein